MSDEEIQTLGIPIVDWLADRAEETESSEDSNCMHRAAFVIEELFIALEAAKSQLTTLGSTDDDLNKHIIRICKEALVIARNENQ